MDQIAIGNRSSVRGFDGESVLLAESGYTLRQEFTTPLALVAGINSVAYLGIDIGRVWGAGAALLPGQKLAGAALGLRAQWRTCSSTPRSARRFTSRTGFPPGAGILIST